MRATFGRLIVAVALVVASAAPPPIPGAWAQAREDDRQAALRDLRVIEQARRVLASSEPARRTGALVQVMPVFRSYTQLLTAILWTGDPAALEAEHRSWTETRRLEIVPALLAFVRFAAEHRILARPMDADIMSAFTAVVAQLERAAGGLDGPLAESDLPRVQAALWKLKFVEASAGATAIAAVEATARALEARVAQRRELEAITAALSHAIAAGTIDAALERQIAALPPEARAAVEALRTQKEDARDRALARAREEQRDREQRLTHQRTIDAAIRLRREELDTGRPNPVAEAQRQQDADLRRAVELWETGYRREQAEKKAEEARPQPEAREPAPAGARGEIAAAAQACTQSAVEKSTVYGQLFPELKKDSFDAAYFGCMVETVSDPGLKEEYRLFMIIANNRLRGIDLEEWCRDVLADADRGTPRPGVTSRAALRCLAGEN